MQTHFGGGLLSFLLTHFGGWATLATLILLIALTFLIAYLIRRAKGR